jgi:hypothetical protein
VMSDEQNTLEVSHVVICNFSVLHMNVFWLKIRMMVRQKQQKSESMNRGPLPVGYCDKYDVMGLIHIQLVMVDQFVLDVVSQKSHAGKLSTVWITSLDFTIDSVEKTG